MGVAILSGVLDSQRSASTVKSSKFKWELHTPGTVTPVGPPDSTVPSQFIACVSREESVNKLHTRFCAMGFLGETVQVFVSQNVEAVRSADVILLW